MRHFSSVKVFSRLSLKQYFLFIPLFVSHDWLVVLHFKLDLIQFLGTLVLFSLFWIVQLLPIHKPLLFIALLLGSLNEFLQLLLHNWIRLLRTLVLTAVVSLQILLLVACLKPLQERLHLVHHSHWLQVALLIERHLSSVLPNSELLLFEWLEWAERLRLLPLPQDHRTFLAELWRVDLRHRNWHWCSFLRLQRKIQIRLRLVSLLGAHLLREKHSSRVHDIGLYGVRRVVLSLNVVNRRSLLLKRPLQLIVTLNSLVCGFLVQVCACSPGRGELLWALLLEHVV